MTQNDESNQVSRRSLLRGAAATGVGIGVWKSLSSTYAAEVASSAKVSLDNDAVVLFQGDSITDAGRDRKDKNPNSMRGLGRGYAMLVASRIVADHAASKPKCINRGISGHRVPDLAKRWDADCIELKPSVLSILIGVNDIWHKLNGRYDGTVQSYEDGLLALLERTRKALPDTRIVLCEPFVLRCGAINDKWFPEFDERRAACRRVNDKMQCTWVPFQEMFDKALEHAPPNYWAGDGVHPSLAGHALMAKTWLASVGA